MKLSQFVRSEVLELYRSKIRFASYNPRTCTDEARKTLKRGIKRFGMVGGLVVNKRVDGYTLVSGHQRLSVMDELHKYDSSNPETDYLVRVDVIEVSDAEEKELNILMNNPNAQGQWDYDALAAIVPDIDYKNAGLTDADLSMIGMDYLFQTVGQTQINDELSQITENIDSPNDHSDAKREESADRATPQTYEEKKQHMKDVKEQVKQQAREAASNMDAYITISFDNWDAKASFCRMYGYDEMSKFIKGEDFLNRIEFGE